MINCIVAVDKNHGIGFKGQLPWPLLKDDMAWFKKLTTDTIVIMGSATFTSIGKPLPNRINVVISKKEVTGCEYVFSSPGEAIDFCVKFYPNKEIFIIGGEAIYQQYIDIVDRFYVTEIDAEFQCDKFFDLTYVQENFTTVKEHSSFSEPVAYKIKEYNL